MNENKINFHIGRLKKIIEAQIREAKTEKEVVDACYIYCIENGLEINITINDETGFEFEIDFGKKK